MKFVELPSGTIVNMNQVAFIQREEGELWVCFAAGASNQGEAEAMHLILDKADGEAIIKWLHSQGGMSRIG